MEVVAYIRVSTESQDFERQKSNLASIAESRGWKLRRVFAEKISGTVKTDTRKELKELLSFVKEKEIKLVMVSEISRLGRRVVDILNTIEILHSQGISLYVQQFNMCSIENGNENPAVKMLIQMMSIGAEMENNLRRERQMQGIQIAKVNGKYTGRKSGSTANPEKLLDKYKSVADLAKRSDLSLREIASITGTSVNTVRKVKTLIPTPLV